MFSSTAIREVAPRKNPVGVIARNPLPPEKSSGCDITLPVTPDSAAAKTFDLLSDAWRKAARYRITLSREGDWNDVKTVAEWLPYDEANNLREKWDTELLHRRYGGLSHWARASYSIELHVPEIRRSNVAAIGDLILHAVVEDSGAFSLSEVQVYRQYLVF